MTFELTQMSARALTAGYRSRKFSPVEVVDAYIKKIESENPRLNAYVNLRLEEARKEARAAEEAYRSAPDAQPVFRGVPISLKEMFAFKGLPHTCGSVTRKGYVADVDSTVARKLKESGAIVLGTTNIPEWGLWYESSNKVYGRSGNPYDTRRTPGGSSGGEAAVGGAGLACFGVGSDEGGSIRMPAFFCGIFGHKASHHVISLAGHPPLIGKNFANAVGRIYPFIAVGPMTRFAEDLMPITRALAGVDPLDPDVQSFEFSAIPDSWKGKRVLVCAEPKMKMVTRVSSALSGEVKRAGKVFESLGSQIEEFPHDFFYEAFDVWTYLMQQTRDVKIKAYLRANGRFNAGVELLKSLVGASDVTLPAILFSLGETFLVRPSKADKFVQMGLEMRKKLYDLLSADSILIFPSHPRVAPKHHVPLLFPQDFSYTGILAAMKVPATQVPTGLGADGIPLGVQIAAGPGMDHLTIGAAQVLEKALGGYVAPRSAGSAGKT